MKRYGTFIIHSSNGTVYYQHDFNDDITAMGLMRLMRFASMESIGYKIQFEYQPSERIEDLYK